MELLNEYFNSLVFYYTEEINRQAVYVAGIGGMLGGENMRYVIAFVPMHLGILPKTRLKNLDWKNLQTRTCPKGTYNVPAQKWIAPVRDTRFDVMLRVVSRDKSYTKCVCDSKDVYFPFDVLMIHSSRKNTIYQYPNTMNLHWAIDQFNTVFGLREESNTNNDANHETMITF